MHTLLLLTGALNNAFYRRCIKACFGTTSVDERRCDKESRIYRSLFGSGRLTSVFRVCRVYPPPSLIMRHHPNRQPCLNIH